MNRGRLVGWTCLSLLAVALAVHGAVPPDAKYRGSKLCIACHRNKNEDIVKRFVDSPMALAMVDITDADKVKAVLKADLDKAPFKKDDVAYIFGMGQREQAFLDKDLKVLPAKWSVTEKKWLETPAVDAAANCVGCHTLNFNHTEKKWQALGVGCESCHGPGSVHARTNKEEDIVNPSTLDKHASAFVCGRCHSKGTNTDGTLPWSEEFRPGDDLTKFFKHTEVTKPGQNQQLNDLMNSKHWQKNVVCTTCHDPHGDTGNPSQLKKPITQLCLTCHGAKIVDIPTHTKDKNVVAPEGATCATCHMPQGRHLFAKSGVVVPK